MKRGEPWLVILAALVLALAFAAIEISRPEKPRMLTLPCAKGLPCSAVVVDTGWQRVIEVKP